GELKQELAHARRMKQFDAHKLEYQQVVTRLSESERDYARLLLARNMLESAIAAWESKSQPEVYRQASRLLASMTAGVWVQVRMSEEGRLQVIDHVKTVREPLYLSLGTCQQLYLSLRIALLMTADNVGRVIPIMADDILVNFDEERRRGAALALMELAEKRQVILFTCHEEIVRLMQDADEQLNVVEL
ncbi:MAG: sugar ABC transporter ATP-binding protein, partial [Raoultibacter sp.]